MPASIWIKYLFGQAEAIRQVAASRSALWTGVVLVLLTSIARNYDQTLISEEPFLWLFGSLLFSLISGTLLCGMVYAGFARRFMAKSEDGAPLVDGGWLSFMGLFWMTAPVAWLYAIPVERFLDSIVATWANVGLLGLVSLWRVVLMTRVLQVTTKAPFFIALVWVLLAASVEVLVVAFTGAGFAKAIMASMGGMRNSPEEEIMLGAMLAAFNFGFMIALVSLVIALVWRPEPVLQPLPCPVAEPMKWGGLVVAACFWIIVAILPQRELAKTVTVEKLIAKGRAREALDFLKQHQPSDFAPARPLPPKVFERYVYMELPACFAVVLESDPAWVRALLMSKLDSMVSHLESSWRRPHTQTVKTRTQQVENFESGLSWLGPEPDGLLNLLKGLQRLPEGQVWLATNSLLTEAIWKSVLAPETHQGYGTEVDPKERIDWLALSNYLHSHSFTNVTAEATNQLSTPAVPPTP